MAITLAPLLLPQSERWRGLDLMAHQARAFELAAEPNVLVEAPTGGGKTWCGAAPLIDRLDDGEGAIFAYPTNALADDQKDSLLSLLERAGKRVACITPDGRPDAKAADILLWRLHGPMLDEVQAPARRGTKGETIESILSNLPDKPLWLVTNPDTLYLLATARFSRAPAFWNRMGRCTTLVLDEFHLYRGPQLVRALTLMELAKQLMGIERTRILSATLGPAVKEILERRFGYRGIQAQPSTEGRVVQYEINLEVVSCSDADAETNAFIQRIAPRIELFRAEARARPEDAPLVALCQSPVSATFLEDRLVKEHGVVHRELGIFRGLSSKSTAIRSMHGKTLVIGTSALEVGVDFRTTRGVFQALSASSFAQRLGRFGRHAPGAVSFLADARVSAAMTELPSPCDRGRLFECTSGVLRNDDDLGGFALSSWAQLVISASLGALRSRFLDRPGADELGRRLEIVERTLLDRLGLTTISADVRTLVSRRVESQLASSVGFRGGVGSVEVFDKREERRRGSPNLARYEVDLPTFFKRATWHAWDATRPPLVVGWSERRRLSLRVTGSDAARAGIYAPEPSAIELRLDNAPTPAESLLRERERVIVGLFPKRLRSLLSWREVIYESGDRQIALLEDDALIGGYLWTRASSADEP